MVFLGFPRDDYLRREDIAIWTQKVQLTGWNFQEAWRIKPHGDLGKIASPAVSSFFHCIIPSCFEIAGKNQDLDKLIVQIARYWPGNWKYPEDGFCLSHAMLKKINTLIHKVFLYINSMYKNVQLTLCLMVKDWMLCYSDQEKGKNVHSYHFIQRELGVLAGGIWQVKKLKGIPLGKKNECCLYLLMIWLIVYVKNLEKLTEEIFELSLFRW